MVAIVAREECVLKELAPAGDVDAYVEQDERVAYFYLRSADSNFGMRSCWVRNLGGAPAKLDVEGMRKGLPPMLPTPLCRHPSGAPRLEAERLRVVWFEEGDAAALLEDERILAIIPGWSGRDGFSGYARDCLAQSPLCWPLDEKNELHDRVRRSDEYWASWSTDPGPWGETQSAQCEAYSRDLGQHEKYYAIDGDQWPPKAMVRIERPNASILATVGMCLRAQPCVEQYVEDPVAYRRIELATAQGPELAGRYLMAFASYLSGQTQLPWTGHTWLGPFHTIPCDAFGSTEPFAAVLLAPDPPDLPAVALPPFRGDPVNVLWAVPITESEHHYAQRESARELWAKLTAAGHGAIAAARKPVA